MKHNRIRVRDLTNQTTYQHVPYVQENIIQKKYAPEGVKVIKAKFYELEYPITRAKEEHLVIWVEADKKFSNFKFEGNNIVVGFIDGTLYIQEKNYEDHYTWIIVNNKDFVFAEPTEEDKNE